MIEYEVEKPIKTNIPAKWETFSGITIELKGQEKSVNFTLFRMYFGGRKLTNYYLQE